MQKQVSEVAALREKIAAEYMAAKLGLEGLNLGTARHDFIEARLERVGVFHEQLHNLVGDASIALVVETYESLPDTLTRSDILAIFQHELAGSAEAEPLCNALQQAWKAVDLFDAPVDLSNLAAFAGVNRLRDRFGVEQTRKLLCAPSRRDIPPP